MTIAYSGYGNEFENLILIGNEKPKKKIKGLTALCVAVMEDKDIELEEGVEIINSVNEKGYLPPKYREKFNKYLPK